VSSSESSDKNNEIDDEPGPLMGGVDLQDQVPALFPNMRRTVKGYRKIFFYLMDVYIFNSFTVYHKITVENRQATMTSKQTLESSCWKA
jgi:hypothetical protein